MELDYQPIGMKLVVTELGDSKAFVWRFQKDGHAHLGGTYVTMALHGDPMLTWAALRITSKKIPSDWGLYYATESPRGGDLAGFSPDTHFTSIRTRHVIKAEEFDVGDTIEVLFQNFDELEPMRQRKIPFALWPVMTTRFGSGAFLDQEKVRKILRTTPEVAVQNA